jgi:hypothetical protein
MTSTLGALFIRRMNSCTATPETRINTGPNGVARCATRRGCTPSPEVQPLRKIGRAVLGSPVIFLGPRPCPYQPQAERPQPPPSHLEHLGYLLRTLARHTGTRISPEAFRHVPGTLPLSGIAQRGQQAQGP